MIDRDAISPTPGRVEIPRSWLIAGAAILLVRLIGLVASVSSQGGFMGDESIYQDVARSVLAGHGFSRHGQPWVLRPPGWPLAVAAILELFGPGRKIGVLWQGLFDTGTVLVYSWLAAKIYRTREAVALTFLLMALWPPFFRESRFLQTEPLFTLAMGIAVVVFAKFVTRPTTRGAWLAGFATACAALVRPTGLLMMWGLVVGWYLRDRREIAKHPMHLIGLLLGLLLTLAPWTIRNAVVFQAFIPLSTGGGEMFFTGTTPETDGRWDHDQWPKLSGPILAAEESTLGHPLDPLERDRAFLRAGQENWKRDPRTSLAIAVKRFFRLCFVPLASEHQRIVRFGFLAALIGLYALAVPQGIAGIRSADPWLAFRGLILIALLIYVLMSSAFYTNSRYMEPVRAPLLVLAAGAASRWLPRSSRHRT